MILRERIGQNIQNLRHSRNLSQEELSLIAEVDRSYISKIELARNSASADKLEQIAHALGVDPQELLDPRGKP
ncbi:helix-turn-helix transcriptional regulator [Thalassobius sp. I31.1]|uniref:helix-turn-helix domain-containing protein n=1 Tax=Thalassobius sp. I31.1 TaxID=2109912 RepID=UPI000D1B9ADC|nr:helix-turn-helix transcriptional regulator [Thalassobius sp. I31.1]